ncbi:hypothetical protein [Terrabacter sp. MAHUQ-38]|uniref:hypothetical protein n=1 Tax=unclassified Terrabacter TaxID=2630222 RepID=UPI00165D48B4|nr:hypothetical protein [Terrabacter sp. MAHUQ-38]MBC9822827.1 hypothetical protein [Terrabacter sp. MAHUQ-38]
MATILYLVPALSPLGGAHTAKEMMRMVINKFRSGVFPATAFVLSTFLVGVASTAVSG